MSKSKLEKEIYLLFIPDLNLSKIGISRNVNKRLEQLQTGCPYKINILKTYKTFLYSKIEKILHRKFNSRKIDSSEYNLVGEWFNLDLNSIIEFESICSDIEKKLNFLIQNNNPFLK